MEAGYTRYIYRHLELGRLLFDFLFAFEHTDPLLKGTYSKRNVFAPTWSKVFPFRVFPFSESRQNILTDLAAFDRVSIPLPAKLKDTLNIFSPTHSQVRLESNVHKWSLFETNYWMTLHVKYRKHACISKCTINGSKVLIKTNWDIRATYICHVNCIKHHRFIGIEESKFSNK